MRGTNFKMLYLGVNMFISVHFALCFTQLLLLLLLHHIDARPINLNARPSAFLEPLALCLSCSAVSPLDSRQLENLQCNTSRSVFLND